MKKTVITTFIATLLVTLAGPLAAHPVHDEVTTFASGLLHPLTDWGHMLSIIAIGLWAGWRSTKLTPVDLISWLVIGLFFAINGYLHAAAVAQLTWSYGAGLILSYVGLLGCSMLLSTQRGRKVSSSITITK